MRVMIAGASGRGLSLCKTSANAGRLSRWHLAGTVPRKTSLPYRTTGTGSQPPVMPSQLFSSLELRSVRLSNRIVVAPMCQYSATDGSPGDWHLMHLGHLALGRPGPPDRGGNRRISGRADYTGLHRTLFRRQRSGVRPRRIPLPESQRLPDGHTACPCGTKSLHPGTLA